jgi:assimilatory nitrate reductase catalytic subunit
MAAPAKVVSSIQPETVFVPYHWPGDKSANLLTKRALDPVSKIPEFKVSAVKVEKVDGRGEVRDDRDLTLHGGPE